VDRELTTTEWQSILETAWKVGIPHVTFTGGEPTLREDLERLIHFAETQGQVTGLLTNGRRLSEKDDLEKLSQAGLDHILLVLIEGDPASEQGLKNAIASDIFTAVHLTLSMETRQNVEPLLEKIAVLGVPAVSLSGREKTDAMSEVLSSARSYAANINLDLIWDIPAPYSMNNPIALELEVPPIGAGRAWLYVEPDGDVLPSQGVDQILGNLLRDSWQEIWSRAQA
jgi:MoaA/NifB/PqqE/SkfB family radical SAM enzyme